MNNLEGRCVRFEKKLKTAVPGSRKNLFGTRRDAETLKQNCTATRCGFISQSQRRNLASINSYSYQARYGILYLIIFQNLRQSTLDFTAETMQHLLFLVLCSNVASMEAKMPRSESPLYFILQIAAVWQLHLAHCRCPPMPPKQLRQWGGP